MPMPPYPIYCYTQGCKNLASYKIAGRWSDGVQSELKTYSLCCADCLPACFRSAWKSKSVAGSPQGNRWIHRDLPVAARDKEISS